MKDPVAAKFLRVMILVPSSARYSSDGVPLGQFGKGLWEVLQLLHGITALAKLVAAGIAKWLDAITDRRVGVLTEPCRGFHDVGVGVVDDSPGVVGHASPLTGVAASLYPGARPITSAR